MNEALLVVEDETPIIVETPLVLVCVTVAIAVSVTVIVPLFMLAASTAAIPRSHWPFLHVAPGGQHAFPHCGRGVVRSVLRTGFVGNCVTLRLFKPQGIGRIIWQFWPVGQQRIETPLVMGTQ